MQQAMLLYEEAQQDMAQDNFEAARGKLRQAHTLAPQVNFGLLNISSSIFRFVIRLANLHSPMLCSMQDMMIMDAFGAFLSEAGPQQEAITVLQRAINQQPDQGFEKYM